MSARLTKFAGGIVAEKRGGARQAFRHDPLGSTIAVISDAGTTTATYTYWPYGEVRSSTGSATTPWKFCGRWGYYEGKDTTTYVRARVFKRDLARWMTVDPLWPEESAYGYASDSPGALIDPFGAKPQNAKRPLLPLDCSNPLDPRWGKRIADAIPDYWAMVNDAIRKSDCCQELIKKNIGDHQFGFAGEGAIAKALEQFFAERWLRRLVFCINCIETGFNPKFCTGRHYEDERTATGVFGFTDPTWRDFGVGDRDSVRDNIISGVKLMCAELCKANGGCKCSDTNAWPQLGNGKPAPKPLPYKNPWPDRRWPYMPGGREDLNEKRFEDCMSAGKVPLILPVMERKKK